ncbi:hypothetical protein ABZ372_09120, partial [Streptomyces sp. NPDC005921]
DAVAGHRRERGRAVGAGGVAAGVVSDLDRPPGYWSLRAVRERGTRNARNTPRPPDTTPGAAV